MARRSFQVASHEKDRRACLEENGTFLAILDSAFPDSALLTPELVFSVEAPLRWRVDDIFLFTLGRNLVCLLSTPYATWRNFLRAGNSRRNARRQAKRQWRIKSSDKMKRWKKS